MCYEVACESFNWFKEEAMFALVNLSKIWYPKVKTTPWRLPSYMIWMGKFNAAFRWKNLNPDTRTLKTIRSIVRGSAIALSRPWHLSLNATKINVVIKWQLSQLGDLTKWPRPAEHVIQKSNQNPLNIHVEQRRHQPGNEVATSPLDSPPKTSEKRALKFHTGDASLPSSDWSCREGNLFLPIRSTTQFWLVTRHQYGSSAVVLQTSTSGGVAKCVGCFLTLKSAGIQWIESKFDTSDSELRRFLRFGFKGKKKRSFIIFGDWILFLFYRNWNVVQFHDWNLFKVRRVRWRLGNFWTAFPFLLL